MVEEEEKNTTTTTNVWIQKITTTTINKPNDCKSMLKRMFCILPFISSTVRTVLLAFNVYLSGGDERKCALHS